MASNDKNSFNKNNSQNMSKEKTEVVETVTATVTPQEPVQAPVAAVVVEPIQPIQTEIKSGTVALTAAADVGTVATPKAIEEIKVTKAANAGEVILSAEMDKLITRIADSKNQVAINAIDAVKKYMFDMAPGKTMDTTTGVAHQINLFRAIRSIIDFSGDEFQLTFVALLRLFDEHKDGVFHERCIFRFMENITLNTDDQRAFERIINLIKIAAPVQGRAEALKQVNMQKTLQYTFTDVGKNRVLGFFNK
jgi:hypothetical protein